MNSGLPKKRGNGRPGLLAIWGVIGPFLFGSAVHESSAFDPRTRDDFQVLVRPFFPKKAGEKVPNWGAEIDFEPWGRSKTGVDLTAKGQQRVAQLLADQLGISLRTSPEDETLRQAVLRKNQLWHQHYRPTNLAFLPGDRKHGPSRGDLRDANRRRFVEELEKLPGVIAVSESEMTGLANRDR